MNVAEVWTCTTCSCAISTSFCPGCGEQRPSERDLTLRGLVDQMAEALSNVDSRLLRSVRCLVTRSGALTAAYLRGQRKPYILPFQLFVMANLLFFAVQ